MINTFRHSQTPRPAIAFADATVADAMHAGVLTCPPETPLPTVARMMTSYGVHAIVVTDLDPEGESDERPWGIVSSLDLARAAALVSEEPTAGGVASTELVTVGPDESLSHAAQLMAEHELTHLVAVDTGGRPLGIVSTHDVAAALAH
jgi:CBS domain-containing protein